MTIEGDIKHVEGNLISTLSKKDTVDMLKEWRSETTNQVEGALITEILEVIREGGLDG